MENGKHSENWPEDKTNTEKTTIRELFSSDQNLDSAMPETN